MAGKPFFSRDVVECARDGSNPAWSLTTSFRMIVSDEGIRVGNHIRIPFDALSTVEVNSNVLTLTWRDDQGHRMERSFRQDAFLPGVGARRMAALAAWIAERVAPPAASSAQAVPNIRAERIEAARYTVRVFSSQVAFPPVCPACCAPATRAAVLDVSRPGDRGGWVVPVCEVHPTLGDSVIPENWSVQATELSFSFRRPDYGEQFLAVNAGPEGADPARVGPALREINAGVRFVQYTYAVSAVIVSFKSVSDVHVVPAHGNRIVHGLPYTLLSLVAGWWGFPWGPIFTIGSLITNFKGGIDLTPTLAAVIRGRRLSARGA